MLNRRGNFKEIPLDIVGSSTFGRYPKISTAKTVNMFISDGFLVDYAGYAIAIPMSAFVHGGKGRGCFTSTKLNSIVAIVGGWVYLVEISYQQLLPTIFTYSVTPVGAMQSTTGNVSITENNIPQVVVSDFKNLYVYDPLNSGSPVTTFYIGTADGNGAPLKFTPGYVDFHDNYIIVTASNDNNYSPAANNTWYLSSFNGTTKQIFWENDPTTVGLLQTKPDDIQAVVRFPSKGNAILVIGSIVTEAWFDQGLELFPYVRSNAYNIDYGTINPATIARADDLVVWLAQNEKSGPIIIYTRGQSFQKITTDGIDFLFANLKNPADSQGFIFRQDGHLIYHLNFYTDNFSLFYDFNTEKFFHATDENGNHFIANSMVFFNNQYYFLSNSDGNMYAFDTIFTTYNGAEIPRMRICSNTRLPKQEYFIVNDLGFTIEQGTTEAQKQSTGAQFFVTQDGKKLITQANNIFFVTQDGKLLGTQDGKNIVSQQNDLSDFFFLIDQNPGYLYINPRVDLSVSIDGGESFGNDMPYNMNPLGKRKNKIQWWQGGAANDFVPRFKFWGLGRFVAYDGVLNIRQ